MSTTYQGYFLIADITGYTSYLSKSELDHAQQTLTSLLNLLIKHTKPPLIISRLAGDAVISYGLQDNFYQGQTFIEMIEETYVAFRRAIDLMVLNTSCQCNACKNISSLDLKFFVHYGTFGIQKLDYHDEMVGADVIVLHRLLKNTVTEKTGIRAYALYTDAAIQQLSLQEICAKMVPHTEVFEHLGQFDTWIQDMHPVWVEKKNQVRVEIPPKNVLMEVSTVIPASPETVWDYLILPEHFNVFAGGSRTVIENRRQGFVSPGTVYQCYHGDHPISQTILEWKPFEHILLHCLVPIPIKDTYLHIELRVDPIPKGICFKQIFSKASGSLVGRVLANLMFKSMAKQAQIDIDSFGRYIETDLKKRIDPKETFVPSHEMIGAAIIESLNFSKA